MTFVLGALAFVAAAFVIGFGLGLLAAVGRALVDLARWLVRGRTPAADASTERRPASTAADPDRACLRCRTLFRERSRKLGGCAGDVLCLAVAVAVAEGISPALGLTGVSSLALGAVAVAAAAACTRFFAHRASRCPACGAAEVVPLDTPAGREVAAGAVHRDPPPAALATAGDDKTPSPVDRLSTGS